MWKCHKCGKPVYFGMLTSIYVDRDERTRQCLRDQCKNYLKSFVAITIDAFFIIYTIAERKQSLGYDWHPECLRCEECGKRLNPGQHAEVGVFINSYATVAT